MLPSFITRCALVAVAGLSVLAVSAGLRGAGAAAAPAVDQRVVATFPGDLITLTGLGLGEAPATRVILFDSGGASRSVTPSSPLVRTWRDNFVELSLPAGVASGTLHVVVDGEASEPVELLVFEYDYVHIPRSEGTNALPLALAVAPDGTVWVNEEFHVELKSLTPDGRHGAYPVPQAAGRGIFAQAIFGNTSTPVSALGEDVAVDGDGFVWFTQGGGYLYGGPNANTSRVVRFDPAAGAFACFNVPADGAEVAGVLVDQARRLIWYAEMGLEHGNAISAITFESVLDNCSFDPASADLRDEICPGGPADSCHVRFPLPNPASAPAQLALDGDGNVWFTEFWGNRIGRLTPETGEIIELPLPDPNAAVGPGAIVGSGPWDLEIDENGFLWANEFFDATLLRVNPALIGSAGCEHPDPLGQDPCIEEVVVASDGFDNRTMHSISLGADGLVWFSVTQHVNGHSAEYSDIGFVAPAAGDAVVYLPRIDGLRWVTGIAPALDGGGIWFADYVSRRIGRLRLLEATSDPGEGDMCVPGVENCEPVDTDGDGCLDTQELGPNPRTGGQRDPNNFWDFYDTPNRTNIRDGRIGLPDDILSVVLKVGANDANGSASINRYSDPLSTPPLDIRAYHPAFDRSPAAPGVGLWDLGPPDGTIVMMDVVNVILQYGHTC